MPVVLLFAAIFLLVPAFSGHTEAFRTIVEGSTEVSLDKAETTVPLSINGSVIINLNADIRFLRGIEIEVTAPQAWTRPVYRNTIYMTMFNNLRVVGST